MIRKILFQGDSITDAGRTMQDSVLLKMGTGYPHFAAARLQADFPGEKFEFENRGISGNRVVDLYARWKLDALNLEPELISILIGVNDTWHEFSRQNGVELDRYEMIYRMLLKWTCEKLPGVKLVLMEPFCLASELVTEAWILEIRERAVIVRKLAEEFHALFIPLQELLTVAAEKSGSNLAILRDGVHPTPLGHQLIADAWLAAVTPLLGTK